MTLFGCRDHGNDHLRPEGDLANRLDSIADIYQQDLQGALSEVNRIERLNNGASDSIACLCLARKASIYDGLGKIDSSIALWESMLLKCDQEPYLLLVGLSNRAGSLIGAGEFELAIEVLGQAEQRAIDLGRDSEQRAILQTLIAAYFNLSQYDSALSVANRAVANARHAEDTLSLVDALLSIGAVYTDLGQFDQAIDYLNRARQTSSSDELRRSRLYVLLNIGAVFDEMGDLDSAAHYYQRAQHIAEDIGEQNMITHINKNQAYLAYAHGQYQHAFDQIVEAQYVEDSIWSEANRQKIADLEYRYETKEKEARINSLTQENRIASLQRNFFIVLTFLFLAIATAAIVIYTNRIRSNKLLAQEEIQRLEKEKEVMSLQSMLFAQEEERQRIARDLHDSIGALLSAARLHLSNIEQEVKKLAELDFLKNTEEMIDRASTEVRRVAHDMMPGVLMKLGLTEGIEDFFDRVRSSSSLTISFTHDTIAERLENKTEIMIYRIVQELVNNTIKHSKASEVKLMIKLDGNQLTLDYRDDGIGFDVQQMEDQSNIGLSGIKSRVNFLQGSLMLDSSPNEGVHYQIEVPV